MSINIFSCTTKINISNSTLKPNGSVSNSPKRKVLKNTIISKNKPEVETTSVIPLSVEEHDFTLYNGRIYIKVFLKNKPLNFMLDIGASGIGRVDAKISKDLGLDSVGVIDNSDGVNVNNVPLVGINKLKFGSIEFKDIQLMSRNYNRANPAIYMDGILGRGFFETYILEIDYPKSKIRFYKGNLDTTATDVLRYEIPFRVKGKIAGNVYEFNFDSGSNLDFHFPKSIIEKFKFKATGVTSTARRANTEFKLHQAIINEKFQIGSISKDSIGVYYSDLANEINVGGVFLRNYKLTIDQKNKCLTIQ